MDLFYYCYSLLPRRCYFEKFSLLMTVDNLWQKWPLFFSFSILQIYVPLFVYNVSVDCQSVHLKLLSF